MGVPVVDPVCPNSPKNRLESPGGTVQNLRETSSTWSYLGNYTAPLTPAAPVGPATSTKPPNGRGGVWPTDTRGKQCAPLFFVSYMGMVRSTLTNTNAVLGVGACTCVCNIHLYLVGMRLGRWRLRTHDQF